MIKFNKEQVYIVTGASSGIGEGVALMLNELGASVVAIARRSKELEAMKVKCKYPENMFLEIKDLAEDIEVLPNYIKELKNKYGKFSGLAYCAGVLDIAGLQMLEYDNFQKLFSVDYFAPIFMMKGIADKRNNIGKGTSIVCVSSATSIVCNKGMSSYSGAKAALIASVKCIAKEVAKNGVRVNTVSPTDINSPMQNISNVSRTEFLDYPLGVGEIDDVANMIAFLLSEKAKWLSAQNYIIDCGCF